MDRRARGLNAIAPLALRLQPASKRHRVTLNEVGQINNQLPVAFRGNLEPPQDRLGKRFLDRHAFSSALAARHVAGIESFEQHLAAHALKLHQMGIPKAATIQSQII